MILQDIFPFLFFFVVVVGVGVKFVPEKISTSDKCFCKLGLISMRDLTLTLENNRTPSFYLKNKIINYACLHLLLTVYEDNIQSRIQTTVVTLLVYFSMGFYSVFCVTLFFLIKYFMTIFL